MEFSYNRRLLLLDQDVPYSYSKSITSDVDPPITTTNNTSSSSSPPVFGNPLLVPQRSIFSSNIAYAFIIILTSLLLLAFIIFFYFIRRGSSSQSHPSRQEHEEPTVVSNSLPAFSYRGDEKHQLDDCAICLEEFREGEKVKMIVYCKHVFHPECIDTWLAKHVTCPICRCNKLCEGKVEDENGDGRE